ncbi:hypothetical protein Droror1_Dr00003631 [Drosera rotundifolia]
MAGREDENGWWASKLAGTRSAEGPKSPKTRSTNTIQSPNKHRGGASYYSRPDLHLQTPEILQKTTVKGRGSEPERKEKIEETPRNPSTSRADKRHKLQNRATVHPKSTPEL